MAFRSKQSSSVVIVDVPERSQDVAEELPFSSQAENASLSQLFGAEEPPYAEQPEDRAGWVLGTFFYTWLGDLMHQAAREELTLEGLPRPMRAYRAYNAGVRLAAELRCQQARRHAWDGAVGARVRVRWDAASDGVLRWVGVVQSYGTPDRLYAGVEWRVAPANRGEDGFVGVLRRFLYSLLHCCKSSQATPQHGFGTFHHGEVDGERLFDMEDGAAVATCEQVKDLVFLPLHSYAATAALPGFDPDVANKAPSPQCESVMAAVFTCFQKALLWLLPIRAVVELTAVLSPMALRWYLGYLSAAGQASRDGAHREHEPTIFVVLCSVAFLFVLQLVHSAAAVKYDQLCFKYAYAGRSALCACIATKCLLISPKSVKQPELNVGRVLNLVANDVGVLTSAFQGLWMAITIPIMLVVVLWLLYDMIGSSAFIGVALIVVSIPVQAVVTYLSGRCATSFAKATDARLRLTNEFLSGIRTVKFMGRELQFEKEIDARRAEEIRALRNFEYVVVCMMLATAITPTLTVAFVFVAYSSSGHAMSLGVVYPAISLLQLLQTPYRTLSSILVVYAQLKVSMRRLTALLAADEVGSEGLVDRLEKEQELDSVAAAFSHATVSSYEPVPLPTPSWRRDDGETHYELRAKTLLQDVDLRILRGKLTVVLGPTGSGKSTLLDSLIGALAVTRGRVACSRRVAYVPQQPWIMNATLRDNVVFFAAADAAAFERAVASSQLAADVALLADGAETEIGEKGINLSGGQKARVSLARAVYADRDVYVLDDPLSALDAHVGERVMRECVCGSLAGKTRVLATHQVSAAAYADYVVLLEEGRVVFQGTYLAYRQYAQEQQHHLLQDDSVDGCFAADTADELASAIRLSMIRSRTASGLAADSPGGSSLRKSGLKAVASSTNRDKTDNEAPKWSGGVERTEEPVEEVAEPLPPPTEEKNEEEIARGPVPWRAYRRYIEAAGGMRTFYCLVAFFVASELVQQSPMVWLSLWSAGSLRDSTESAIIRVFVICVVCTIVVLPLRSLLVLNKLRDAGLVLHRGLLAALTRATLTFFDTTPLGRITNRVARDMDCIDVGLPLQVLLACVYVCFLVLYLLLMMISQPIILVILVPCVLLYGYSFRFFCAANREMQRLLNVSNSPVFSILNEILTGRWTICSYRCQHPLVRGALHKLDGVFACGYMKAVGTAWLTVRVQLLGNVLVSSLALVGILSIRGGWISVNVGVLALCVSNASILSAMLSGLITQCATVEASMSSVERVLYYTNNIPREVLTTPTETSGGSSEIAVVPTAATHTNDARTGSLEFSHVDMRYRPGLPLVLRDVSFAIAAGQKVGVVGRTGSGKSTLLLAFLRLVEVCGGCMRVCGRDARDYGVRELRQLFSMIPQDPLLFDGTVRSNVDPFGGSGDGAVWGALRQVGMEERVRGEAGGLECRVQEGGSNFSVGQRQLLCLARALLKKGSVFLLMDEATANVDPALDRQIQRTVQHTFRDYTVVTIAHRLHTVAAYDVIFVMNNGCLAEFGSPVDLVSRSNTVFSALVRSLSKGAQQAFFKALNGGEDE